MLCLGRLPVTLQKGSATVTTHFVICPNVGRPILSLAMCRALRLVHQGFPKQLESTAGDASAVHALQTAGERVPATASPSSIFKLMGMSEPSFAKRHEIWEFLLRRFQDVFASGDILPAMDVAPLKVLSLIHI